MQNFLFPQTYLTTLAWIGAGILLLAQEHSAIRKVEKNVAPDKANFGLLIAKRAGAATPTIVLTRKDSSETGYRPMGKLPAHFIEFNAVKLGTTAAILQWKTSSERRTSYFEIERSDDAVVFTSVGRVTASGNSGSTAQYRFTDFYPMKNQNFYRIRQVDRHGKFILTPARALAFDETPNTDIKYAPNPAEKACFLELTEEMGASEKVINIIDASGVVVDQLRLKETGRTIKIDVSHLPRSVYFIQYKSKSTNTTQQIVVPFS